MKISSVIVFYQIGEVLISHIHPHGPINLCISVKILSSKKNCLKLPQPFACAVYCPHANDNTHGNRSIKVPMCKNGQIPCEERLSDAFENSSLDGI